MNLSDMIKQTLMEVAMLGIFPQDTNIAIRNQFEVGKYLSTIGNNNSHLRCELQCEYRRNKVPALSEGKRFSLFVGDDKTHPVIAALGTVYFRADHTMTFLQRHGAAGSL